MPHDHTQVRPKQTSAKPSRDGDRVQARQSVYYAVRRGRIPHPSTLACVHCGQPAKEYDHHLGYAAEHHYDVQPICRPCNIRVGFSRGERIPSGNSVPRPPSTSVCIICDEYKPPYTRGRCERCRGYLRKHGVERPTGRSVKELRTLNQRQVS